MGIHDRDYVNSNRGMGSHQSGGNNIFARAPGWSVTTWLIVINITIHMLAIMIFRSPDPYNPLGGALYQFGELSVHSAFQELHVWRLITFQFLHSPTSMMHLLMNMFGMWVFGPMVEQYLGGKIYLAFYLMCGLAGGILFAILTVSGVLANGLQAPLIGASAGVFGVIVACAHVSPNSVIQLLFPPIPMKMRTFAYGYVAISLVSLLMGSSNAGGEAAHIGGAIAGYFFIRNSGMLTDFFDVLGDSRKSKQGTSKASKKQSSYRTYNNTNPKGPSQDDIDKILQKVSQKGLASLSDKEKKTLAQASKNDE